MEVQMPSRAPAMNRDDGENQTAPQPVRPEDTQPTHRHANVAHLSKLPKAAKISGKHEAVGYLGQEPSSKES